MKALTLLAILLINPIANASDCNSDQSQYLCNGDFEMPLNLTDPLRTEITCASGDPRTNCFAPYWKRPSNTSQGFLLSRLFDGLHPPYPFYFMHLPLYDASTGNVDVPNNTGNNIAWLFTTLDENGALFERSAIYTILKKPLTPFLRYEVSYDVRVSLPENWNRHTSNAESCVSFGWDGDQAMNSLHCTPQELTSHPDQAEWKHVSFYFVPQAALGYMKAYGAAQNHNYITQLYFHFDNFSVKLAPEITTAISNQSTELGERLLVYPNPVAAGSTVTISTGGFSSKFIKIELFDMQGATVHQEQLQNSTSSVKLQIPANLAAGNYLIRANNFTSKISVIY